MKKGTPLIIELHVKVWHPNSGEAYPREKATAAMYEIQDGLKEIVEKHGLTYIGCGYGVRGRR